MGDLPRRYYDKRKYVGIVTKEAGNKYSVMTLSMLLDTSEDYYLN